MPWNLLRRWPQRVKSLVCLHSPFVGLSQARTEYQINLQQIVQAISASRAQAEMCHSLMKRLHAPDAGGLPAATGVEASTTSVLSVLDPDMTHITAVPLQSATSLYRYCTLLRHYLTEAPRQVPRQRLPVLILSADDDAIAHSEASREVAALLGAELQIHRNGGHFAPCKDDSIIQTVLDFINRVSRKQPGVRNKVAVRYSQLMAQ